MFLINRSPNFDRDTFHDYVVAHGHGKPNQEGFRLGAKLVVSSAGDYATAAAEVVFRGLTLPQEELVS